MKTRLQDIQHYIDAINELTGEEYLLERSNGTNRLCIRDGAGIALVSPSGTLSEVYDMVYTAYTVLNAYKRKEVHNEDKTN